MAYNYNNQQTNIPEIELVQVTGGRIEFTYKFNYTKIENRNTITGYAYGIFGFIKVQFFLIPSLTTKPLTFVKVFFAGYFLPAKT